MSALDEALAAAKRGWFIFPVKPNAKHPPLIHDNLNSASGDPRQIAAWAKQFPGCNWGLSCGKSDLTVLDVDVRDGKQGRESLKALEERIGALRNTLSVKTPSGGRHFYFEGAVPSSKDKLGKDLDVKSIGGYVLLPGSKTDEGVYEWVQS